MTKNGKVHISMKDIWEVICCHGNNIQTRIMFSFVDCYSWLIIIINNNNNNNNNIAIGHGVGPAWAAAYYGRLDAPYLQSLGYYPWQVIATPKAPLSGLRHLAIYGLNRKPNYLLSCLLISSISVSENQLLRMMVFLLICKSLFSCIWLWVVFYP